MTRIDIKWLFAAVLLAMVTSSSLYAGNRAISWYAFSSTGGEVSSASHKMNGTAGQQVAGYAFSATHKHWIGFWYEGVAGPPPTVVQHVDDAKLLGDGERVSISGKIASSGATDFTGFFYMQESDRSSGIRVDTTGSVPGLLARGKTVSVVGTMDTVDGERRIVQASVIVGLDPLVAVNPLGMTGKSLGGGTLGLPPNGQIGVQSGTGLNNIGLLVKVWGNIDYADSQYMLINDGSGVTVMVDTSRLGWVPFTGMFMKVVGESSMYGAGHTRYVLPRDSADVE